MEIIKKPSILFFMEDGPGIKELFDQVIQFEKDTKELYKTFLSNARRPGLRHLLEVLVQSEDEHVKALSSIIMNQTIDLIFETSALPVFNMHQPGNGNPASINDMMHIIMQREDEAVNLFSKLADTCRSEETAFILTSLAFEEKKHYNWAVDQYELEMLSQ